MYVVVNDCEWDRQLFNQFTFKFALLYALLHFTCTNLQILIILFY